MGVVMLAHNPFEPADARALRVQRPMTVRRFVSRRRELRRYTSVRPVAGGGRRKVREFDLPTICRHNGRIVLRADWSKTVIRDGDVVIFMALPKGGGGGGGGGGSNPLPIILAVAIAVAAPYLAGLAAGALVAGGLVSAASVAAGSMGLSLLTVGIGLGLSAVAYGVMSLFVQPPPPTGAQTGGGSFGGTSSQASPTYTLQAQGNTARLGQPIPELFGQHLVFPDFAHQPYERFEGNEMYLHQLLVVTTGWCSIDQVRAGETPVDNFPEIEWQMVEPGGTVPTALVDPMMLVSTDLAQIELPGSEAGSPWKGPFIVNPATTVINRVEIDLSTPQGLFYANNVGGLDPRGFVAELELREIDDEGSPIGAWTNVGAPVVTDATRTPGRYTFAYDTPSTGRFEARMRRSNEMHTTDRDADSLQWFGLRGRQPGSRTYPGVTLIAIKARATGSLSGASNRRFNCIATRKLCTWDAEIGAMTTTPEPTRSPCDAAAYICLARNAGRLAERQVDLSGIYAHKADYAARGWTFDGVFDTSTTCWEALSKIGRCVIAQPIIQGPKVRLVRDLPSTAAAMVFTPRNITKGNFELNYVFPDEKTADAVEVQYIDRRSWKPATVMVKLPGSLAENPSTLQIFGCTNRKQGVEVGYNFVRSNRYRRRIVNYGTEMEGLLLLFGDRVMVSHDMPRWGQAAEVVDFDESTRTLLVDQPLTFESEGTHYLALRQRDGTMFGPLVATATGDPRMVVLGPGALPELSLDGDAERTHAVFGKGEAYAKPLKIIGVIPRSATECDVVAIDDDPRVYDPIPEAA